MSNPTDGLPRELIEQLDGFNRSMAGRTYPADAANRHWMEMAVWALTGLATRQLNAATCLIDAGWAPESHSHVRTTWELSVDLWFLLSLQGAERNTYARRYLAMSYLRAPSSKALIAEVDAGRMPESHFSRAWREADAGFGGALDLREHWSGVNKGELRDRADAHLSAVLNTMTPMGMDSAIKRSKTILFDYPSQIVHADPGAIHTMPHEGVSLRTQPLIGGRLEGLALAGTVASAFLMLVGINRRRGDDGAASTQAFNERVRGFLLRVEEPSLE